MSFLRSLFRADPEKALARAEALLADGEPVLALERLEKILGDPRSGRSEDTVPAPLRERARTLDLQAREALVARTLAAASEAEEHEDWADAASWMASALEHLEALDRRLDPDRSTLDRRAAEERRQELDARRRALEERVAEEDAEDLPDWFGRRQVPEVEEGPQVTVSERFDGLVAGLREPVAERWQAAAAQAREPFERAVVDLNEGNPQAALPVLDSLVAASPEEHRAVHRFERGRCRLLVGNLDGALEDFEAVRDELGPDPLDHDDTLSLPFLWADIRLEQKDYPAVIEHLEPLATGRPVLEKQLLLALLEADRPEDARDRALEALADHPTDGELRLFLARALERLGEQGEAIEALEPVVAASCSTGSCSRPEVSPAVLFLLTSLHLDRLEGFEIGSPEDRAGLERVIELLDLAKAAFRGQLPPEGLELEARFFDRVDDPESAALARAEAERLRTARDARDRGEDPSIWAGPDAEDDSAREDDGNEHWSWAPGGDGASDDPSEPLAAPGAGSRPVF